MAITEPDNNNVVVRRYVDATCGTAEEIVVTADGRRWKKVSYATPGTAREVGKLVAGRVIPTG
jgi:hypothetical protein